jgi:hypothetical protein
VIVHLAIDFPNILRYGNYGEEMGIKFCLITLIINGAEKNAESNGTQLTYVLKIMTFQNEQ